MEKNVRLKQAAETLGIIDAYVYDNFLVEKNNTFVLRSGSVSDDIYLYCPEESRDTERDAIVSRVIINGEYRGLRIKLAGLYNVTRENDSDIKVEFKDTIISNTQL